MVDVGKLVDAAVGRAIARKPAPGSKPSPKSGDRPDPAADSRRARVVLAAVEAVEESGPAAGMGEIAERAGIPRPHLYRLFSSKEQLDSEVVRFAANELVRRVRPHFADDGTPIQIVRGVVAPSVAWAAEHPQLYRFLAAQRQTYALHGIRTGRSRFLDVVIEALGEYLRAGNMDVEVPEGVLAALMGMVDAGIIWWLDHADETQPDLVDRLSRHVLVVLRDVAVQHGLDVPEDVVLRVRPQPGQSEPARGERR